MGKITTRFARVLNTMDKVEIAAVASRDLSRSKKFAQEFNAKTVCTKYEEVIQSKDVDLVYIGLTNNFHYKFTKYCLEQHKPVLCEKPMVTTRKEAEELVSLAQKNQTFLMGSHVDTLSASIPKSPSLGESRQDWSGKIDHCQLLFSYKI